MKFLVLISFLLGTEGEYLCDVGRLLVRRSPWGRSGRQPEAVAVLAGRDADAPVEGPPHDLRGCEAGGLGDRLEGWRAVLEQCACAFDPERLHVGGRCLAHLARERAG